MKIPDFVFANGGTKNDWIPNHDEFSGSSPEHLNASTKEIWWRNNWTIRIGLKTVKTDVELKLAKKKKLYSRETSISNLSRITRLNRETIKHPDRYHWVRASLDEIKNLCSEKITLAEERSSKDKSLIANLRRKLDDQRQEIARIYLENQDLINKLDVQNKINENYRHELERIKRTGKTVNFSPNLSTE